ncbi:HlyD family secretion protein [Psychromonas hadalis]|uniref:HlyD family secretion protein n=1 Tax=Psychromonas hadalis TaxID=211669 RepID=UPI0003B61A2A|nr:HlyD family efflux transporter periplasmic adaptor subunit [Psychromonas hadalis]
MKVNFKLHKQRNPSQESGVKVSYGQTKRLGYRIRWFLILFLVLSPVVMITYKLVYPNLVDQAPAILSFTPIDMVAPKAGLINIKVRSVGDSVKKGEVLYQIQDRSLEAEITFLETEVAKFNADSSQQKTRLLYQEKVSIAYKNLVEMKKVYKRYLHFSKIGQLSAIDFAAIVNLYNNAEKALSSAKVELQVHQTNYSLTGQYADSLRAVKKALVVKKGERDELTVYSPYDAFIIEISVISGQMVSQGQSLMMISDAKKQPEVIAYLDAKYILNSQVGRKVTIEFPDGRDYAGIIAHPTELASKIPSQLSKPFEAQKSMMKVVVHFVKERPADFELMEGLPLSVLF